MNTTSAKTKLLTFLLSLCMVIGLMPVSVYAAETEITEVNLNGVSNELWSNKDVPFATLDEGSNYTIESQRWSSTAGNITPSSEVLKPKAGEYYSFVITLKAEEGYVFPTKAESNVFFDGVLKVNGIQYDNESVTVSSGGKKLTALLFSLTTAKGTSGGSEPIVKTTVRNHYTEHVVTESVSITRKSGYVIDGVTLGREWFKLDGNQLVTTNDQNEAIISIETIPGENKSIMAFTDNAIHTDISLTNIVITIYTGAKLTYTGTTYDPDIGNDVIQEIRDNYYYRIRFNNQLNLIAQKEIDVVEINNATLTFKDGDKPVFTGTTSGNANYAFVYEAWQTDGEGICSEQSLNSENNLSMWGGKLILAFDKNKTYTYKLCLKTTDAANKADWCFGPNTKLKINGQEVAFQRDSSSGEQQFSVTTVLTMTPQETNTTPDYKITMGANGTWTQNSDGTLQFVANGDFSKFTGIKVDGTLVAADQYTAVSGSTIITLKSDYLRTLSVGKHILTVVYKDGECATEFEIKGTASHTHSYGSEWKQDATNHWHECACGDKADTAAHTFKWIVDKNATATEEGSQHEECSVCGYKKAAVKIPATNDNGSTTKKNDSTTKKKSSTTKKNGSNAKKNDTDTKTVNNSSPKTGDESNLMLWIAMLWISGCTAISTTVVNKRKKYNR